MYTLLVDVETTRRYLRDSQWVLVDCRFDLALPKAGRLAYVEAHLPGARYADLNKDLSSPPTPKSGRHPLPDPNILAAKLGQWGIDRQSQVVVYDASHGAYAARLWWLLRWLGHDAVALLDGGWQAWLSAGYTVEASFSSLKARHFVPNVRHLMAVDTHALQAGLHSRLFSLVDARSVARYRGDEEPIDPVAGHIPGARNLPYTGNMTADGRFSAAAQLRERFAEYASSAGDTVHMCGSGVTACHNILAMEIAGLRGSRLYPGSWSEWIRDPDRAVKTGDEA